MITAETLNGHPCRVLVVEDEALIAMLVEDMLHDGGGEMVGSAGNLTDAVALAQNAQADVALLDLNLGGALAYPVADVLRARGMPLVFTSGYGSGALIQRFQDCPMLDKPFDQISLEQAIGMVLRSRPGSPELAS
jgi:CheY-like chemotaxis protein